MDRGDHSDRNRILVFILASGLALSSCFVVDRVSGISEARELQKVGEPASAKILKIGDTGLTVNNDPVVEFLLEVYRPGYPPYQARTRLRIGRLDIPRIQPGAAVPVRIDPKDPQHVTLDIYEYGKQE